MFPFQEKFDLGMAQYKVTDFGGDSIVENWFPGNDRGSGLGACQQERQWQEGPVVSGDHDILDEFVFNAMSPSFQICFGDVSGEGVPVAAAENAASLEAQDPTPILPEDEESQALSVEEIIEVAAARFIQMCSLDVDLVSKLGLPLNLSDQESQDVHLVELLLLSAEKVHYQQFDRASKLLAQLSPLCPKDGNTVERLVHYFSRGLRERIDRETGRMSYKEYGRKRTFAPRGDVMIMANCIAFHQGTPFLQVAQFTGVQAIVDAALNAERIHVIDLQIGSGVQWTALIQALASRGARKVELLKITALGMSAKKLVDGTGNRLTRFAKSLNIPFEFRVVVVQDILDLRKENFALGPEETVMVYAQFFLRTLISQPDRLEALMKVIRSIAPRRMVVTEVEANHNSPAFVDRFIECLFYHGMLFDCMETLMDKKDTRMSVETGHFLPAIKNMIATEGEERKYRNVKVDVWKAFFSLFHMTEVELSDAALYQARLIAEQFCGGKFCTLESKGKSLIFSWKGTPVQSISVYGFA
ncbi:hypothetical protein MLD38_019619 [Melastoma candidum]|uniref:Uncharacterized protein n=1 Tax=Melastoma candidum TaxID=119954 RepID=A0ACB9R5W1_9MYRT|nr:hypothetical protein MLD38_019619 [Melastoma candidum]